MNPVIKILICIIAAGSFLYFYIDKQNEIVELRMAIPSLSKRVKAIHEENNQLKYQVDKFESPEHLMELSRQPEYSHLKFPKREEVIVIERNGEG